MRYPLRLLVLLCTLASIAVACGDRFAGVQVTNRCTSDITAAYGGDELVLRPGESNELLVNAPDETGVEIELELTSEAAPDWRSYLVLTNGSGVIVSGSGCPE